MSKVSFCNILPGINMKGDWQLFHVFKEFVCAARASALLHYQQFKRNLDWNGLEGENNKLTTQ